MKRRSVLLLSGVLLFGGLSASAENWPGWRGPSQNGHSGERGLPLKWSAASADAGTPEVNVRWKTPLPGPGMSSPIVWGNRVFVTQALDRQGHQRALLCFDRKDGRQLWQRVTEFPGEESTYASEPHFCSASPSTDGERVVASFGSAGLVCYDLAGNLLWKRELGPMEQIWGNAASPVIYRDRVLFNFGPGERQFLIALDKKTGKDLWRADEPGGSAGRGDQSTWVGSWSTPTIARIGGRDEVLMSWPLALKSYDPETGKLLWSCGGLSKLVYTSPLVSGDTVVAMSGFQGPAIGVRTGGSGDVTETHRLWREEKAPQRIGTGVIVGEHFYLINDNGVLQCTELKSGKTLWTERATGRTWGSLVCADGRLYATSQQGETVVIAAKPVFEVLARNPLYERSQSTPAISDGEIFIRTYGHLWCIGEKK